MRRSATTHRMKKGEGKTRGEGGYQRLVQEYFPGAAPRRGRVGDGAKLETEPSWRRSLSLVGHCKRFRMELDEK